MRAEGAPEARYPQISQNLRSDQNLRFLNKGGFSDPNTPDCCVPNVKLLKSFADADAGYQNLHLMHGLLGGGMGTKCIISLKKRCTTKKNLP